MLSAKRVGRLHWWLDGCNLYDALADRWENNPRVMRAMDHIFEWHGDWVARPISRHILPRICDHDAEMDHCCMPKHDHCKGCGMRMPGQAKR